MIIAPASYRRGGQLRFRSSRASVQRHDGAMAAVEAWFLGGPVDGRLMPVEVTVDGSPPAVLRLPEAGFYVGASHHPAPAVEHVYVLAERIDVTEVYRYQQSEPEATG